MEFTKHKAVISGVGTTLTALATAWAAVEVATADGTLDIGEYGPLATAVATVVATIYAVWRVPNQVVTATGDYERKMGRP